MPLYQAIILALVQALTEFLPISSTAHLILFPWLFGWVEPGQAFDVALHAGTLLAVLIYFFRTWLELGLAGIGIHYPRSASPETVRHNRRLFWCLVAGTIPAGVAGLLLERVVEEHLRRPVPIGLAMVGVALLMWWAESRARLGRTLEQADLTDSMTVGTAQAFALFPGVSRSGITIVAGLWRGMTRETSARFSFLLATPVIAGAAFKEIPKLIHMSRTGGIDLPMSTLLAAIATSAIFGYLVIAFFLRYLQTRTLKIFIYYRLVFGIVILLLVLLQSGFVR